MSLNLAELGLVLCQEFDQRELELNTLHSEIRTRVKNDREELSKLTNVDHVNQMKDQKKIMEDARGLLDKYRADRATLVEVLKANVVSQIGEMNSWAGEREEELRGWYKAGGYMLRKPEEQKDGHKARGYMVRKRTGG